MSHGLMREILGLLDIAGAIGMLWSAQRITAHAGFHSRSAVWAMLRRVVYLATTFALASLGLARFSGEYRIDEPMEFALQMVLLIYILFFPFARSMGFVTQDALVVGEHQRWTDRARILREHASNLRASAPPNSATRGVMSGAAQECERIAEAVEDAFDGH